MITTQPVGPDDVKGKQYRNTRKGNDAQHPESEIPGQQGDKEKQGRAGTKAVLAFELLRNDLALLVKLIEKVVQLGSGEVISAQTVKLQEVVIRFSLYPVKLTL